MRSSCSSMWLSHWALNPSTDPCASCQSVCCPASAPHNPTSMGLSVMFPKADAFCRSGSESLMSVTILGSGYSLRPPEGRPTKLTDPRRDCRLVLLEGHPARDKVGGGGAGALTGADSGSTKVTAPGAHSGSLLPVHCPGHGLCKLVKTRQVHGSWAVLESQASTHQQPAHWNKSNTC